MEGAVPNVFWGALSMEDLRKLGPIFTALAPAPHISGPSSYRLVRQDTPLWSALHRGCLTGGHLNAALGFYEPACARKLGMPTSFVGHQRLLAAYGNLLKRPHGALSDVLAAPAVHTGSAAAGSSRHQAPAVANKRKDATKARQAQQATPPAGSRAPPPQGRGAADGDERRKRCLLLAAQGQHKVSGAWGSVQEASALHALLGLLGPGGPAMEEAGLFWLEPAPLEAAYGLPPGSLPPMGASPDALLHHEALPPAPHDVAPGLRPSPPAAAVGTAASAAGPPGRETLQGLAAGAGAGFAVVARGQAAGAVRVWGPGVGFGPGAREGAGGGAAGCGAGLWLPGGAAGVEPVEVKSTCPFQQRVRRSRKGHQTRVYAVADRGPMQHVPARCVPQLQLECLATGAPSALLCSRSATKGMTVFRIQRDEGYLRAMLHCVARLHTAHVLPRSAPPLNPWWALPEYHAFVNATRALAASAALVASADALPPPPGCDERPFLD